MAPISCFGSRENNILRYIKQMSLFFSIVTEYDK